MKIPLYDLFRDVYPTCTVTYKPSQKMSESLSLIVFERIVRTNISDTRKHRSKGFNVLMKYIEISDRRKTCRYAYLAVNVHCQTE